MIRARCALIIALVFPGIFAQYTSSLSDALRTELYTTNSYDMLSRPDDLVNVTVQMLPIYLNDLNIVSQDMNIAGFLDLSWTDSRLSWSTNPTYNSMMTIFSTSDYTWRPTLIIADAVHNIKILDDDTNPIRIAMNGEIRWTPIGTFVVHCDIDVTYYPFDTQACSIEISTWGYGAAEVDLKWDTTPLDLTFYKENGEWEYKEYKTTVETIARGPKSYSTLTVYLKFKRRPNYQVMNTITPCMLLGFLSCLMFKLPADSGEKIGFALTVLLAYAVYLTMVSVNIPTTSLNTSIITLYLLVTLILGIMMTGLTIFVLGCYHTPPEEEVTNWMRILCSKYLCKIAGLPQYDEAISCCSSKRIEVAESEESKKRNYKEAERMTWQDVSKIMDAALFRISFLLLLLSQIIFMFILLIGWVTIDPFDDIS